MLLILDYFFNFSNDWFAIKGQIKSFVVMISKNLKNTCYAILGLGRFGLSVALALKANGQKYYV